MYFVYELVDPRTDVTGYVGITNNPKKRHYEHLYGREGKGKKYEWIRYLQKEQIQPKMRILETVNNLEHAKTREQYWIQYYINSGIQLTNVHFNKVRMRALETELANETKKIYYTESEVREILNINHNMFSAFIRERLIKYSKTGYYLKVTIDRFYLELEAFRKKYGIDTLYKFYGE
jgi:hypothetical protein